MDEAQLVAEVTEHEGDRSPDSLPLDLSYIDPNTGLRHQVQMKTASVAQDPVVVDRVKNALESDRFKWRTVRGIANEIGVGGDVVKMVIAREVPDLIIASDLSQAGEFLFSTRQHYKKTSSLFERIIGVLKNRAA